MTTHKAAAALPAASHSAGYITTPSPLRNQAHLSAAQHRVTSETLPIHHQRPCFHLRRPITPSNLSSPSSKCFSRPSPPSPSSVTPPPLPRWPPPHPPHPVPVPPPSTNTLPASSTSCTPRPRHLTLISVPTITLGASKSSGWARRSRDATKGRNSNS